MTGAAVVISGVAKADPSYPALLRELIDAGKLTTVIDKRYSLDQIADAHRHAEGGHKRGHVVVRVLE
jgi:NADPH:quinone reductase-like Zn-dependent oxidoreductase